MHHIIKKIQEKPHHHRLMYFWILTSVSTVASFGIWLTSLNSLLTDLAKSPEKESIKKTVNNLSNIADDFRSNAIKTKASIYEAAEEFRNQKIDEIKNQPEPDTRIPNQLPIN